MEVEVVDAVSNRLSAPILTTCKDWALSNGLCLRKLEDVADEVIHGPFTAFPSPFSKENFQNAIEVQQLFNQLIHAAASNHKFLLSALERVIPNDTFTMRLWNIYEKWRTSVFSTQMQLGLLRCDYMADCGGGSEGQELKPVDSGGSLPPAANSLPLTELKQVEINTIASSFAGLATKVAAFHRFMNDRTKKFRLSTQMPTNGCLHGLALALVEARRSFSEHYPRSGDDDVIVMVCSENERNVFDQRLLEYAVYEIDSHVTFLRRSLTQLFTDSAQDEDGHLILSGSGARVSASTSSSASVIQRISVVYYRAGYGPDSYKTEEDWTIRERIELSTAIKCPSVAYQLAGTKKVQQVLSKKDTLERLLGTWRPLASGTEAVAQPEERHSKEGHASSSSPHKEPDDAYYKRLLRLAYGTFAQQYSLDLTPEGDAAVQLAIQSPEQFVLKPQREGGGNNYYGTDVKRVLESFKTPEDRCQFILMQCLHPLPVYNYPIRAFHGPVSRKKMVGELGVFGAILANDKEIKFNRTVGHLLRSKVQGTDEGGVAAGYAFIDSPLLV